MPEVKLPPYIIEASWFESNHFMIISMFFQKKVAGKQNEPDKAFSKPKGSSNGF